MKLFHKIFLCCVIIFGIAFQIAGYLTINFAYENAVEQEKKYAFQEFQYNKYILQSVLYSSQELLTEEGADVSEIMGNFTVPIALYGEDAKCIFSNLKIGQDISFSNMKDDNQIAFQMLQTEEESYILVYDSIRQSGNTVYLITETDISQAVSTQGEMISYLQKIDLVILCIGFPVILLLTNLLTGTINNVSKAAKRIAEGRYSERIAVTGQDEIGELAADFNRMAEKIEEKIAQLSDTLRQKEDFAANFAHELKTPMTSVIGYADMLYQRELPREQVKSAAECILNEGMRLEALSLKLMDLFVMDKQDFVMERFDIRELFDNIKQGIEPVCRKYDVNAHIDLEEGKIDADYDLFKTMILNIVDNSVKADCKDIWITGKACKDAKKYQLKLTDNGKGIPIEELERITEAFYMVDKSRSRKQHGAGLGMALVAKIVAIHKAEMKIESDGNSGTTICLVLKEWEGRVYEEKI